MYTKEEQIRLFEESKKLLNEDFSSRSSKEEIDSFKLIVDSLREVLHYNEWLYYVQDDPQISDYEYDVLFKKLEAIEHKFPELITPDSPTQRVGGEVSEGAQAVRHLIPMLSLENSYNAEDLLDFDKSVKKLADFPEDTEVEYVVEPKFDGGTIVLVYENDVLVRASTRGNGTIGEDMTHNAKVIRSIPLKAGFSKRGILRVELRGEALIKKDTFDKINKKRTAEGLQVFANPRNAATGGLRTKDAKETAARGIEAFVYQMGFAEKKDGGNALLTFKNHHEIIEFLGSLGFKIPELDDGHRTIDSGKTNRPSSVVHRPSSICKNINEVIDFCNAWQEKRDSYDYEIDGMVVKVNDLQTQSACGSTSHHPRWAVAFKFKAKQATTQLLNVEFQVGKIGTITPVAKLNPVQLAGVTVSSVSLHNEDFINSKDIRIGDFVLVERSGDVIPYIVKSLSELRKGDEVPIKYPEFCPFEMSRFPSMHPTNRLVRKEGEAAWRCENCICGRQDFGKYVYHVSKDAMDIEGLSGATIERFVSMGWINSFADFYRLDYEKVSQLEGFGKRSAENLKNGIEKAKKNSIQRVLNSLSVHHLGRRASKLIAAEVDYILDLQNYDVEKLTAIKEIGPVLAQNIVDYFSNKKNIAVLQDMESLGVNMHATEEDKKSAAATSGVLLGKTILFTGALMQFTRESAEKLAAENGATIASGVSKNLNILVVGEKAGSKLTKAQAIKTIQILTEQEFVDLVK